MIVRYWQPFEEIDTLRRHFDQIFDDFIGPETTAQKTNKDDAHQVTRPTWAPTVTLVENENDYQLAVHLPGVDANTVDIQASRKSITISGERPAPDDSDSQRVLHNEVRYGTFRRVVNLPATIDHEQVAADYDQGILTVRLPKSAEVLNRVVKVNIAGVEQPTLNATDAPSDGE